MEMGMEMGMVTVRIRWSKSKMSWINQIVVHLNSWWVILIGYSQVWVDLVTIPNKWAKTKE